MTRRDVAWRTGGGALFAGACGIELLRIAQGAGQPSTTEPWPGLVGFAMAIAGLVVLVQGKRIAASWRAERRRLRRVPRG